MKIDCVSDLHGFHPKLEGGDVLVLAGDYTASGTLIQWGDFFNWLGKQSYRKKILIAGNHDNFLETAFPKNEEEAEQLKDIQEFLCIHEGFEYLCDYGTEFEGLKIWGSPWTPTFGNWHFMKDRGTKIQEKWNQIPSDVDILITHGPPFDVLDKVPHVKKHNIGNFAGCQDLKNTIESRLKNLKLHVFGHIHEGYGEVWIDGVHYVNASIMNGKYCPVNQPIRVVL